MLRSMFLGALIGAPAMGGPVADFEGLPFAPGRDFENGANLAPPGGFVSGGAFFNNSFGSDPIYGEFWSGWSYSRETDITDLGANNYLNQYAAITGGAASGDSYAVAFAYFPNVLAPTLIDSYINVPAGAVPVSALITNTAYAYYTIRDGSPFGPAFGPGDTFRLIISGRDGPDGTGNAVGAPVLFTLADYGNPGNPLLIDDWTSVDLSSLAGARSLVFALETTDVGPFGPNTPTYFALDALAFATVGAAVPEPATGVAVLLGVLVLVLVKRADARLNGGRH